MPPALRDYTAAKNPWDPWSTYSSSDIAEGEREARTQALIDDFETTTDLYEEDSE